MSPSIDRDSDLKMPIASLPDEMGTLEETYQVSRIEVGQEVDYFASELDRYNTDLKGSPAEKRAQVFKLVDSYYSYTRARADKLLERQRRERLAREGSWQRRASAEMDVDETEDNDTTASAEELLKVEEEAHTWDLLRRILPLRYRDAPPSQSRKDQGDSPPRSRKQYWDDFLLSESLARERKVVLEWLQNSASHGAPIDDMVSDLQQSADRGDILAHGWLHTRHNIKLQKSVNAYQGVLDPNDQGLAESHLGSKTLITQLDPDAMTRQSRKLEPQDDFFERAIWLGCFEMLRRGYSMSEIRDWCSIRTELWRAATMSPLPLSNPEDEDQQNFKPDSLVLWRRMCFATAKDGGTGDYDRAVYGLLAGDIPSVEKVCKTWDDFLFAHYNALLRTQFDSFLVRRGGEATAKIAQRFPAFNAVHHHSDPMTVGKRLVASLEEDARTAGEAVTMPKVLQGVIIANDLDRHMYYQGIVISEDANESSKSKLIPLTDHKVPDTVRRDKFFNLVDHDSLRILAHILIIVSTLDRVGGAPQDDAGPLQVRHQLQELIIVAYLSFLRLSNFYDMLPLYCSKLYGPRLYHTLSRNVIGIAEMEGRAHQLTLMKKLGLDVAAFVKIQPQIYLDDVDDSRAPCEAKEKFKILAGPVTLRYGREVRPDFFGEDPELVDDEDELIIRALEWLLLVPGLFVETCTYATRAYKYFLKRMHLRAARALFNRVPCREVARTKTPVPVWTPEEEPGPNWLDDFLNSTFPEEWLEECNASKEELSTTVRNLWELECLVRALDAMETLSSLAGISREEGNTSREMLQHASREIRTAKANMRPVLKNWLMNTNQADSDSQQLREAYIPETVLAYVSSLHFVGTSLARDNLLECMELAAVIAEKGSDVAQEFINCGRMKELVEAFASCSKALAVWTSEKKGSQANPKKLREMGWSRELWSVKP